MPAFRFLLFCFAGTFLLGSCGDKTVEEKKDSLVPGLSVADTSMKVIDGGGFQISVYAALSETDKLVPSAKIQYQDYENELYLIVTEEPKQAFIERAKKENEYDESKSPLDNFSDFKMDIQRKATTLKAEPGQVNAKIGGLDAAIVAFAGKPEGMDIAIFYKLAFIDGGDTLYTVMAWTMDSYKAQHLEQMDRMLYSFRKAK